MNDAPAGLAGALSAPRPEVPVVEPGAWVAPAAAALVGALALAVAVTLWRRRPRPAPPPPSPDTVFGAALDRLVGPDAATDDARFADGLVGAVVAWASARAAVDLRGRTPSEWPAEPAAVARAAALVARLESARFGGAPLEAAVLEPAPGTPVRVALVAEARALTGIAGTPSSALPNAAEPPSSSAR